MQAGTGGGEAERLHGLLTYERQCWKQRYRRVAGIDEAGRGALAGPVVAAAVIFDDETVPEGVNDSKKLTPRKRERLYGIIRERAAGVGVGIIYHDEIDRVNIYQATIRAMDKAVASLDRTPDYLLIDGMRLPGQALPQSKIIDGDACCYSIAAASIIAKVTRDRLMCELDKLYPQYGFAKHKGYGTRQHMDALEEYKPCRIHRRTFNPVSQY